MRDVLRPDRDDAIGSGEAMMCNRPAIPSLRNNDMKMAMEGIAKRTHPPGDAERSATDREIRPAVIHGGLASVKLQGQLPRVLDGDTQRR